MKMTTKISLLLMTTMFMSCEMDLFSDFGVCEPTVEIKNVYSNGISIVVNGEVTGNGSTDIEYYGASYSLDVGEYIAPNQKLIKGDPNGEFWLEINDIDLEGTVYFRSFAANNCAVAASSSIPMNIDANSTIDIPCDPDLGTFIYNTFEVLIETIEIGPEFAQFGGYGLKLSAQNGTALLFIEFSSEPISGIYTTVGDVPSLGEDEAKVRFENFATYNIDQGYEIYVQADQDGFTVTFCDLQYMIGSLEAQLIGRFSVE